MLLNKTGKMIVVSITLLLASLNTYAVSDMTSKDACYKGLERYITDEYKKALGVFKKAAKKKDACSQFQLGMMYYYGHGVKKNNKNAKTWLKKSLSNGLKKAEMQLDIMNNKNQKSGYWTK